MKRSAISAGKTYVGKDGKRRTVRRLIPVQGRTCLEVYDHAADRTWLGMYLEQFAQWAVREVKQEEPNGQ